MVSCSMASVPGWVFGRETKKHRLGHGRRFKPIAILLFRGSASCYQTDCTPVENLAESLQVAFDAGAKRLLLPMASVKDIPTIPGELFAKFQTGFYADPVDAVFKALGVQ